MRYRVVINPKMCKGYDNCIKGCSYGVMELIDNIAYPTNPIYCRGSEECMKECEETVINARHVKTS